MSVIFAELAEKAIDESERPEFSDLFYLGKNYFSCGFSHEKYYNHSYAVAIAIIGKRYASDLSDRSDYHNGIAYISNRFKLTKKQVKALRKNFKVHNGYEFKTPYCIPQIVEEIIKLLHQKENDDLVKEFCKKQKTFLYRDMIVEKQYKEIKIAASMSKRQEVLSIEGKLGQLTQRFES